MKQKIAIIGSGVMGSGIAQSFAIHGYSVMG
ncbi:3-hydroxyacyl-CoA dehydrogenase NAD-binding domain-containing protein [Terrilactibacillus sp. S3-3]|nr:3-hydroxyacyl-CoA dehydrogenase NAD-binding domain-containing protein [Terrilactibacillus sp. S3-3]